MGLRRWRNSGIRHRSHSVRMGQRLLLRMREIIAFGGTTSRLVTHPPSLDPGSRVQNAPMVTSCREGPAPGGDASARHQLPTRCVQSGCRIGRRWISTCSELRRECAVALWTTTCWRETRRSCALTDSHGRHAPTLTEQRRGACATLPTPASRAPTATSATTAASASAPPNTTTAKPPAAPSALPPASFSPRISSTSFSQTHSTTSCAASTWPPATRRLSPACLSV
mmetsp:Transcript_48710/g.115015  ORF Transcript_48710/g.115015 Transcript_48710/m.115015 type:complete len:226 (-) Transcript_48710:1349-2026(-)